MNSNNYVMNNIIFILSRAGEKLKDLEEKIGVPSGYLTEKCEQSNSEYDTNVIVALARELHVSVDTLLSVNMSSLPLNTQKMVMFLDRLNRDTKNGDLCWERESAIALRESTAGYDHPLFEERYFNELDAKSGSSMDQKTVFPSFAYDVYTTIWGDCYHLELRNGATLHIMNISGRDPLKGDTTGYAKEIWICTQDGQKIFYCSNQDDISAIANLVDTLYSEVRSYVMHANVRWDIQAVFDTYMREGNIPDEEIAI